MDTIQLRLPVFDKSEDTAEGLIGTPLEYLQAFVEKHKKLLVDNNEAIIKERFTSTIVLSHLKANQENIIFDDGTGYCLMLDRNQLWTDPSLRHNIAPWAKAEYSAKLEKFQIDLGGTKNKLGRLLEDYENDDLDENFAHSVLMEYRTLLILLSRTLIKKSNLLLKVTQSFESVSPKDVESITSEKIKTHILDIQQILEKI